MHCPDRAPDAILAGPVNLHQLVVGDVLHDYEEDQFLLEAVLGSRDRISHVEQLDRFHGLSSNVCSLLEIHERDAGLIGRAAGACAAANCPFNSARNRVN